MDKRELRKFISEARVATYASNSGKVESPISGAKTLEYTEEDFLYRDIYFTGKNNFSGIETIYFKNKPVWSMVYYGNWGTMTEHEIDKILRQVLSLKAKETRFNENVEWKKDDYVYSCAGEGSIDELHGLETITQGGNRVYVLHYHGGVMAKE